MDHKDDKTTVNIFIIHTEQLDTRKPFVGSIIRNIQECFSIIPSDQYTINTSFVLRPNSGELNAKEIESQIKYDKTGDPDFDNVMQPLSFEDIANTLKHVETWQRIVQHSMANKNRKNLYIVFEDDAVFIENSVPHLRSIIDSLVTKVNNVEERSITFLGLVKPEPHEPQETISDSLLYSAADYKVVPNKEAYIVTAKAAQELLQNIFPLRLSTRLAISYIISRKLINSFTPVQRITVDGSKIGLIPSALHPNNLLLLNNDYMQLWQLFCQSQPQDLVNNKDNEVKLKEITELYKRIEHFRSPDAMHLYGALLFKAGRVDEAKILLDEAIDEMQKKKGLLNSRSDLLNNTIQIYQQLQNTDQNDIKALTSKSKYED